MLKLSFTFNLTFSSNLLFDDYYIFQRQFLLKFIMKTGHFSLNLMISKGHIENCVLVILAQLQNTLKKKPFVHEHLFFIFRKSICWIKIISGGWGCLFVYLIK